MRARLVLFVVGSAAVWSCGGGGASPEEDGGTAISQDGGPTLAGDGDAASMDTPGADATTCPHFTGASGIVLRGGSVIDPGTQAIERRDVYVCAGVIVDEACGQTCSPMEIDVSGKWLIPSLNDVHVHARGVSLGDGNFQDIAIDTEASMLSRSGVTSFLDAMNDEAKIFPIRDAQRAQGLSAPYPGADIFCSGGAFTPTGGHGTEYGLPATSYRIVDSVADVATQIADLATRQPDVVKIMYDHRGSDGAPDVQDGQQGALGIAMRKDVMVALIAAANARNLKTEVHIGVWSDARDAILAGATAIAHLGEPVIPDDIVTMARQNNVYWIPTQSLYHGLTDVIADQTLLDDPLLQKVTPANVIDSYRTAQLYLDPFEMRWLARHTNDSVNVRKLHDGGVKLLAGTDVVEVGIFIGWSLHRELKLFVDAGLTPWEALATATTSAGELLGHSYGIEPGAEGNVVVLDASPIDDIWNTTKISMVIHHGNIVATP